MTSHHNSRRKSSLYSDDFDHRTTSTSSCPKWYRLFFAIILIVLAMAITTSLIIILYRDAIKEKSLREKKKSWVDKWKILEPYVKKFPLGFLLGFIRNLIVLAIERQTDL